MILRVTMQLTEQSIGLFEDVTLDKKYTGSHIAVFECALKTQPALTLIDHTHKEFVMSHRLNFANWRIVDIDNYMKGNHYFS